MTASRTLQDPEDDVGEQDLCLAEQARSSENNSRKREKVGSQHGTGSYRLLVVL